jgi:GNAT superfamily N-acetyltransferase
MNALAPQTIVIRSAAAQDAPALADILLDCVAGGASVSFMADTTRAQALAFFQRSLASAAAGERVVLLAEPAEGGAPLGTVQLILDLPPNQPHRGDVAKMLVHRRARRQGLGERLMRAVEDQARQAGRTLLVLDTVTGSDAARLYARLGWQRAGDIPHYALFPDGRPCSTTYYYRNLA